MEEASTNDKIIPEAWPMLDVFAAAMRARLDEKAPERGTSWTASAPEHILEWMNDHLFHLEEAIYAENNILIRKKAVDVANFAMMIFDVTADEAQTTGNIRRTVTEG